MTITYAQVGDYLLPNLIPPESPKVGRWGMLRFNPAQRHDLPPGKPPTSGCPPAPGRYRPTDPVSCQSQD